MDLIFSWRGYRDDVLRAYNEARALSDVEWLVRPVFWAWLFLGVRDLLSSSYSRTENGMPPRLEWQVSHLRKHSTLPAERT